MCAYRKIDNLILKTPTSMNGVFEPVKLKLVGSIKPRLCLKFVVFVKHYVLMIVIVLIDYMLLIFRLV